eukprot:753790-Hanusia_phi.AAC.3
MTGSANLEGLMQIYNNIDALEMPQQEKILEGFGSVLARTPSEQMAHMLGIVSGPPIRVVVLVASWLLIFSCRTAWLRWSGMTGLCCQCRSRSSRLCCRNLRADRLCLKRLQERRCVSVRRQVWKEKVM